MTDWSFIKSFSDLIDHENHQMPGWTLLMLICKTISDNFVLPKTVIAVFSNVVIFNFIKKHSAYPFISILFFGFILYLNLNFNALRQLMALSVFLLAYDSLINKRYLKYYIIVFIAYLFHSSALICILFPLLHLIKLSTTTLIVASISVSVISILLLISDLGNMINLFIVFSGQYLTDDINALADMYLFENFDTGLNIFGIAKIIVSIISTVIVVISAFFSKNQNDNFLIKLCLVYCIFYALNFSVGVAFTRLLYYVDLFYICILPLGVIEISKRLAKKNIVLTLVFLSYLLLDPIAELRNINKKTDYPLYVQYYPYYSVFNPQIDPVRDRLFGSYN